MIPPLVFFVSFALCVVSTFAAPAAAFQVTPNPGLPSNAGGTGLWDMPSARLMPDWHIRVHSSLVEPYLTGAVTATFLPWLEGNARFTKFRDLPGLATDKALDVKIRLLEEDEYRPAIVLGATDIHGTALFTSRYLVFSKYFGPFDMTVGLGQGVLAGEITKGGGSSGSASQDAAISFLTSSASKTRVFGGVEFRITEDFSIVAEYSTLDYEELEGISDPAGSPVNFGMKYRMGKSIFSASYQRGDEFGGSFSANFPLGPEGMLPWKKQPFWKPGDALKKKAEKASNDGLSRILQEEVAAERFSNVRTSVSDASAWVEIENPTYLSNVKALGRALRAVCALVPARIEWVYISLKSKDIILLTIKICRKDFEAFIDGRIDADGLLEFIEMDNEGNELRDLFQQNEAHASPLTEPYGSKRYLFELLPSYRVYINDPEGFYRHSFAFVWNASLFPWAGGLGKGSIRMPLYSDITTDVVNTEKDPVRTDTIKYLERKDTHLEVLAFDQVFNLPNNWLARAEAGIFESAYAGFGFELFRFFQDGRWGIGLESEIVKKRDLDDDFKLLEGSPTFETAFLNIYHKLVPSLGVEVGLKLGRFLAGDWGGRLDVSRTFRHFTMGGWYSVTDTSDFEASYNKGYNDKGLYIIVPFSIFKDHDHPLRLFYGIRPWTRDPGQTVSQINFLYPMADHGNIDDFARGVEELKD